MTGGNDSLHVWNETKILLVYYARKYDLEHTTKAEKENDWERVDILMRRYMNIARRFN